jgi:hypothetical protein
MTTTVAILLIAVGAVVLLFGKRTFVLFAGVGALLGIGLVNFLPSQTISVLDLLIVFGLAIAGGLIGFFVKGLSHVLMAIIGFLAGGAITFGILDALGLGLGLWGFLLALLGGVIGLILANRFFDWAIIILAALTGALLVTRGLQLFSATFVGIIGTFVWIVLAVVGFVYLSRGKRSSK